MTQHSKNETSEDELQAQLSAQTELVNQLTVKNMALEYDNNRLRSLLYESWRNKGNIPPEEVDRYELTPMLLENMMKILLQPVYKFDFNNRVLFGLCAVDIRTLKDLLVEIKVFKMYHLRCFRGFETKSFENVYDVLHQNDILDENNDSYLFEFI